MATSNAPMRPLAGRELVGCYIWLDHRYAEDYSSLIPDPETGLLVKRHRAGTYWVELPGGALLPLAAKYIATVPPAEQRRIDAAMGHAR